MLSLIDYLAPSMNFKIQRQRYFKTNFGGFGSLIFIFIAIFAFLGFGRDIFEKKLPNVHFNRIFDEEIPITNLTESTFLFSFYDQYSDQPIPEFERRFDIYYDFLDFTGEMTIEKNFRIPLKKCSKETLKKFKGHYNRNPDSYYCFPKNISLINVATQGYSSLVRIQLDFCQNSTNQNSISSKQNCYTKKETQNFLSSNRIQMEYITNTYSIDTSNYSFPENLLTFGLGIDTSALSWTRLTILFKKIMVTTDTGFLIPDWKNNTVTAYESGNSESIYSPDTDTVFSILIGNSPWKEIYSRRYIKVQDVFAMMGGFLNFSLIFLRIIVEYVERPKLVDIFNNVFRFDYKSQTLQNLENDFRNSVNVFKSENALDNSVKMENFEKLKNYDKSISKIKIFQSEKVLDNQGTCIKTLLPSLKPGDQNILNNLILNTLKKNKSKNYAIRMNFFLRIFRICFSKSKLYNKQMKFYYMLENKFHKEISFENVLKTSKNVKIMKNLLFDDYQSIMMKYCISNLSKSNKLEVELLSKKYAEVMMDELKRLDNSNNEHIVNSSSCVNVNVKLYDLLKI
jgi:hypothetical protein